MCLICPLDESPRDSSLKDPSLKDPSLKDPSLKDPSLKDPSLKGPSLKGPSLKGPSLKGYTNNIDVVFQVGLNNFQKGLSAKEIQETVLEMQLKYREQFPKARLHLTALPPLANGHIQVV